MDKKTIYSVLIGVLFLVITMYGALALPSATVYYKFDNNESNSTLIYDSIGAFPISTTGATYTTTNKKVGLSALSSNLNVPTNIGNTGTGSFSMCGWLNTTNPATAQNLGFSLGQYTGAGFSVSGTGCSSGNFCYYTYYSSAFRLTQYTPTANVMFHFCGVTENNRNVLYINGVLNQNVSGGIGSNQAFTAFPAANYVTGAMDDVEFFIGSALTALEVEEIYNRSLPPLPPANTTNFSVSAKDSWNNVSISNFSLETTESGSLNFSIGYGALNRTNVSMVSYNLYVDTGSSFIPVNPECFFGVGGFPKEDWNEFSISRLDSSSNTTECYYSAVGGGIVGVSLVDEVTYGLFNLSGDTINFTYNFSRIYTTSNGVINTSIESNVSSLFNFTGFYAETLTGLYYNVSLTDVNVSSNLIFNFSRFAPTFPAITLNPSNAFTINNYSSVNQFYDDFPLNITFSDDAELYSFEINISNSSGSTFYNITNVSLSGLSYTFYHLLNTSNWSGGVYNIEVLTGDSHTSNKIPDYDVTKQKSKIIFKTQNDNNIKIETQDSSDIDAVKFDDRYSFVIEFDDGLTKDREFRVKSDKCPLDYLEDSSFKGHFVSYCDGDGNWVDFEGVSGDVSVVKLDDYDFKVLITDVPSLVEFKSIGGLNIYYANFTWFKGEYEVDFDRIVVANFNTSIRLNVLNSSTFDGFINSFEYNNTPTSSYDFVSGDYNVFESNVTSVNDTTNVTLSWAVFVNQGGDGLDYIFLVDDSQYVAAFGIDNCSISNQTSINVTIYDEDSPSTKLLNDIRFEIQVWADNNESSTYYFGNLSGANSYRLCIFPTFANLSSNIYIQNYGNNLTHRYYDFNGTLDNSTTYIRLYNFNGGVVGELAELRITDRYFDTYGYFSGVVGKLQRRYVEEGVWRTIQMDKSGDYGLNVFDIRERVVDYRLIFTDTNNNVLKTTQSLKFACNNDLCELVQLLSPYSSSVSNLTTIFNVSYVNSTGMIFGDWYEVDGNNVDVEFFVFRETGTSSYNICNENKSGASGTFSCNVSGLSGVVYYDFEVGGGSVSSGFIDLQSQGLGIFIGNVEGGIWAVFIIVTIVMVGVFSPVGAVIATIIGLVFVSLLGIFTPITLTFILVAAVMGIAIGIKVKT